jgi:hypothetical protein
VTLPWWALLVGAVGCLLLGSLLTFAGVRADDDGGRFRPVARFEERRGFDRPGPPFGPPGRFHDFEDRGEDGDDRGQDDRGQDEDEQDEDERDEEESPTTTEAN